MMRRDAETGLGYPRQHLESGEVLQFTMVREKEDVWLAELIVNSIVYLKPRACVY